MNTFTCTIQAENASFEGESKPVELARLLRKVADKVEQGREKGMVIDFNGNKVGEFLLESE